MENPEFNEQLKKIIADINDQEYQPAPYVVEDERQGYDQDGNWHTFRQYQNGEHDPNGAGLDPRVDISGRLADEMQDYIRQYIATSDYFVGSEMREDLAEEYTRHLIDQNAVEETHIAWDGLIAWRKKYGQ